MSIRSRLTLSFAILAALSVLAAAIVGYTSTSRRVRFEIDLTLRETVVRAVAPGADGRVCRFLLELGQPGFVPADGGRENRARRSIDVPGSRVQCLDPDGALLVDDRLAQNPGRAIPIDDQDRTMARERLDQVPARPNSNDPTGPPRARRRAGATALRTLGSGVRLRTSDADGGSLRIATGAIVGGGAFMVARDLDESTRVLTALRDRFALIGVLVTLVAAALGAFVARAFAKPIRALTDVTASIASNGALDSHTAIGADITGRRDELGRLAQSFASMIGSLRTSRSQQRQLAQDAGHELRTPLTTLQTNVDVLAKYPDLSADKRASILQEMHDELRELSTLTDELLVLATDATPDDPIVSLDLAELATRSIDRFQRRTGRSVNTVATVAPFRGRRLQVSRAIDNVLANSAKFDSSSSPIEVRVGANTISVRDHGTGFAEDDLERVFDRFYRSDTARTLPGTGLGLAIVADAAAAHHGTATASNHPGGGAVVTLQFRDADQADKADQADQAG